MYIYIYNYIYIIICKCIYVYVYVSISIFICTYMLYTFFSFFLEEMKCDSCPSPQVAKIS